MRQVLGAAAIVLVTAAFLFVTAAPALAQYFDSGSTGADGAFNPSCTPTPCTVTVTLPANGTFNYTTVSVASGITVKYASNAANTPVFILAQGNVTITGTIDISGAGGAPGFYGFMLSSNRGLGGPGGFHGGNGSNGLAVVDGGSGLGPGGGAGGPLYGGGYRTGGGGGYLTAGSPWNPGQTGAGGPFGTPTLQPLVGGSGGGGGAGSFPITTAGGGGGGGGAILIAAGTSTTPATITVSGSILAKGGASDQGGYGYVGGGSGSGGAVRLVAQTITGAGTINLTGGQGIVGTGNSAGGYGRLRLEAVTNTVTFTIPSMPSPNPPPPGSLISSAPQPLAVTLSNAPTLTITSIGGISAPATLTGSYSNPDFVLPSGTGSATVNFAASNIPLATTLSVTVRGQQGAQFSSTTSTGLAGTVASSTASASVSIPTSQPSVVTATATFTLVAGLWGAGPFYAEGELVDRVRVTAAAGGVSDVVYLTRSGREIRLGAIR